MYAFTASLTSSNLAWASSAVVLAEATAASNLVTASCNPSWIAWAASFFLAVSSAVLAFSKVSFCFSNAAFCFSNALAFSVASALSLSATLVNFSIFSAISSAISWSFLTIGLEASLL